MTAGDFINQLQDALSDYNMIIGSIPSKKTLVSRILGGIKGNGNHLKFNPNVIPIGQGTDNKQYFDVTVHCIIAGNTYNMDNANVTRSSQLDDIIAKIKAIGCHVTISSNPITTPDIKTGKIEYDIPVTCVCTLAGFFAT